MRVLNPRPHRFVEAGRRDRRADPCPDLLRAQPALRRAREGGDPLRRAAHAGRRAHARSRAGGAAQALQRGSDRRAGAGRLHRQLHQSLQRRPASGARSRVRVVAAVVVVVLALAVPAAAQIYQWTDTEGVTRYTNDRESIPPEYRERAREIDSPQARPEEPGRVEVPATDPSVIPITGAGPIRTSVSINGVGLTLVLDTGADRTVISPAAFARTGLDTGSSRVVSIIGVTGSATAREVTVPLLDVAGARVGPLTVIVHDVGLADIDGLLGRDVLDRFTLTVDSARGRATLVPR
ncbi:MAG: hypothetical protein DMD90_13365 [Candidatus Rokuibacteriota bacterium]|nr:MAG: hypothetical protein DMD90_13365 [Candidatus Rokubacteria bacterium]